MSSKLTGFMDIKRKNYNHRSISERVKDFDSVYLPLTESEMMASQPMHGLWHVILQLGLSFG